MVKYFDAIFPDKKLDYTSGMDDEQRERLKQWGKPGVTHESTRRALEAALGHMSRLSFINGVTQMPSCRACYLINDWIYLKNIAQSNDGFLVVRLERPKANSDEQEVARARILVDSIDEPMMIAVQPNIKIYRAISAKLSMLMDSPLDARLEQQLLDHTAKRDEEMLAIVDRLKLLEKRSRLPSDLKNDLMRVKAQNYNCIDFDGSSVDQ